MTGNGSASFGSLCLLRDDEHRAAVERVIVGDWRSKVESDGPTVWNANKVPGVRYYVIVKVCEGAINSLQVSTRPT